MDNPLNAALWLVNTMVERGASLKKGDVILSGALGPMVPVIAGDRFIAEIEGLGTVSVSFEN
jgi:2-keto-4-pentenoate hydratase